MSVSSLGAFDETSDSGSRGRCTETLLSLQLTRFGFASLYPLSEKLPLLRFEGEHKE